VDDVLPRRVVELVTPEDAVVKALLASNRPLSQTDLTHPVREANEDWATPEVMSRVLTRLVVQRKITRRPVVPPGVDPPRHVKEMDVQLCDYHPAGRDPWPYGVGGERRCSCEKWPRYAGAIAVEPDGDPGCPIHGESSW
jgi:hypothetical protein